MTKHVHRWSRITQQAQFFGRWIIVEEHELCRCGATRAVQ
jgi:hypothetical protein